MRGVGAWIVYDTQTPIAAVLAGVCLALMTDYPTPLEAAVECVIAQLSEEHAARIKAAAPEEIALMHFGLGQWIRNNFGLWGDSPLRDFLAAKGIADEDEMSVEVIRAVQARLRGHLSLNCEE